MGEERRHLRAESWFGAVESPVGRGLRLRSQECAGLLAFGQGRAANVQTDGALRRTERRSAGFTSCGTAEVGVSGANGCGAQGRAGSAEQGLLPTGDSGRDA